MSVPIQLPLELLERIILDAWSMPLSNDDRIHFMTSFLLINSTWKALFVRISYTDVHIPCPSYLDRFMAALAGYSPLSKDDQSLPRLSCQSITTKIQPATHVESGHDKDDREPPMGIVLSNLLYYLDGIIDAPNLRTLRIEYDNMGTNSFDDIFDCWRFAHFPKQVTNLEISFSFDDHIYLLCETHHRKKLRTCSETESEAYSLHNIKSLFLAGASDAFVADMIACCPSVERVTVVACK